jgi:hypothetical protein
MVIGLYDDSGEKVTEMEMFATVHYPVRHRRPWQRRRCRCGLRLWDCPDFQQFVYAAARDPAPRTLDLAK